MSWRVLAGLAAVAFLSVAMFQGAALLATQFPENIDTLGIQQGYHHAVENGTARWWFGGWINHGGVGYFRPVSSYIHYAQLAGMERFALIASTLLSALLLAGVAFSAGVLSFLLTRRAPAAYLTTILCAVFWVDGDTAWMASFIYADNLACVLFQVVALIGFVRFLQTGKASCVPAFWLAFILSGLCKEQGWIFPLLTAVLLIGTAAPLRILIAASAHVALLTLAAVLMLRYAKSVSFGVPVQSHISIGGAWTAAANAGHWWLVALAIGTVATLAICYFCRARLHSAPQRAAVFGSWMMFAALCMVIAPTNGLPPGSFALVYLVDNMGALLADAFNKTAVVAVGLLLPWLLWKSKNAPLAMVLCAVAAMLPSKLLAGADMDGMRFLLLLPYVAATLGISIVSGFRPITKTACRKALILRLPSTLYPRPDSARN